MTIKPDIWGPHFWTFFHMLSMRYPQNPTYADQLMIIRLLNSINNVLPCHTCQDHYLQNIKSTPISKNDLKTRDSVATWFIKFHNIVNTMLKKPTADHSTTITRLANYTQKDYIDCFTKVLGYITEVIKGNMDHEQYAGIKNFISCGLYFSGVKGINGDRLEFHDITTYKSIVKKLEVILYKGIQNPNTNANVAVITKK